MYANCWDSNSVRNSFHFHSFKYLFYKTFYKTTKLACNTWHYLSRYIFVTYIHMWHIYNSQFRGQTRWNETSVVEAAQFICQRDFSRDKRESRVSGSIPHPIQNFYSRKTLPSISTQPWSVVSKSPQNHRIWKRSRPLNVIMSQKPYTRRDGVTKAIRNDLLRWTWERHAGDYPLDKHLLRDKTLELTEHGLIGT